MPPKQVVKKVGVKRVPWNPNGKYRNVFFTLNNYNDNSLNLLKEWTQVSYAIAGKEVAGTGTPHLQGYAEFKQQVKGSVIMKKLAGADLSARYLTSTSLHTANYCRKGTQSHAEWKEFGEAGPAYGKDADVTEWGTISLPQGYRSDIARATDMIDAGTSMADVARANPDVFVKFHTGLYLYRSVTMSDRCVKPEVIVNWGPTGTGKTWTAENTFEAAGLSYYTWKPTNGNWWTGYDGEENVVIDEFRANIPMGELLSLLGAGKCTVQIKGGAVKFRGTRIFITSPMNPKHWYINQENDRTDQLLRRITSTNHMTIPYDEGTHVPLEYVNGILV